MKLPTWVESQAREELFQHLYNDQKDVITALVYYWYLLAAWCKLDWKAKEESVTITKAPLHDNLSLRNLFAHRSFSLLRRKVPSCWEKGFIERLFYNEVQHHPAYTIGRSGEPVKGGDQGLVKALCLDILFSDPSIEDKMAYTFPAWVTNRRATERHLLRDLAVWDSPEKFFTPYLSVLGTPLTAQYGGNEEASYYRRLVEGLCDEYEGYDMLLAAQAHHWELARMTFMDKLLIKMGLYEIYHMEEIPISVTIHEYLEIAKRYSSPKSPAFVHGLLNSIVQKSPPASQGAALTK